MGLHTHLTPELLGDDDPASDLSLTLLRGRLASAPERRAFESGASLLRLLVTVRTSAPRRRIDVIPVTLWDPGDELPAFEAGDRVWVVGSVQRRFWDGPEGRRSKLEVVADSVALVDDDVREPEPAR